MWEKEYNQQKFNWRNVNIAKYNTAVMEVDRIYLGRIGNSGPAVGKSIGATTGLDFNADLIRSKLYFFFLK